MVGAADRTISPSSWRTSRNTPCVLGCWGPMLTVIVSERSSGIVSQTTCQGGPEGSNPGGELSSPCQPIAFDVLPEFLIGDLQRLARARFHVDLHRVVFAERKALPVLRHQKPARIGMTVEDNSEQIPDFALQPVGRRPDVAHRGDSRVV